MEYQYKSRKIEQDESQEFRLGEGRISAYSANEV